MVDSRYLCNLEVNIEWSKFTNKFSDRLLSSWWIYYKKFKFQRLDFLVNNFLILVLGLG